MEIVALAELRPKLGDLACRKYRIPRYYPDHRALLEDEDIEAVVAIVRRKHTAPVALDILDKGFHLFTENPMAATVEQCIALFTFREVQEEHLYQYNNTSSGKNL